MPKTKAPLIQFGDRLESAEISVQGDLQILRLKFSRPGRDDSWLTLKGGPNTEPFSEVRIGRFVGQSVVEYSRTDDQEVVRFIGGDAIRSIL